METQELSGESIRPCLIAGLSALSDTHPPYWDSFKTELAGGIRATASIDMVRLHLQLTGDGFDWLSSHVETFPCDDLSCWVSKIRPASWHELWSLSIGDSSMVIGVGWHEGSCKLNIHRAFCEFNPNKVAGDSRFWLVMEKLAGVTMKATLKRYDMAVDLEIARESVRVSKDKRHYQSFLGNGTITEYLGVRSSPGFTKVYDKAREAGLGSKLTRCELTCSGDWGADEVVDKWPELHGWTVPDGTKDWVRVLGIMLAEKAERGEDVEPLVAMLGRGSRPKVRAALRTAMIELPKDVADYAVAEANSWAERLNG